MRLLYMTVKSDYGVFKLKKSEYREMRDQSVICLIHQLLDEKMGYNY